MDVVLRHPGDAKVTTTRPGEAARGDYEVWISDGELVRTYSSVHGWGRSGRSATGRAASRTPTPGLVTGLRADHRAAGRDPPRDVRPPGGVLPERPRHRPLRGRRDRRRQRARGGPPRVRPSAHDRAAGDRPDFRIEVAVDRATGIILRLVEIDGRHRSPGRRTSSSSHPTSLCRRRRSISSSPPGRRCSTELRPFLGARLDAYHRPGFLTSCRKEGRRPDPRAERGAPSSPSAALVLASLPRISPRFARGAPIGLQPPPRPAPVTVLK